MDHVHEPAKAALVKRPELVAPEQPLGIIPLLVKLNELHAGRLQPVERLLIPIVRAPDLPAGIFAEVVDDLSRQIILDELPSETAPDALLAQGNIGQPPALVPGRERRRHGRRQRRGLRDPAFRVPAGAGKGDFIRCQTGQRETAAVS